VEGQSLDVATLPPIPLEPPGQGVQSRVIRQGAPLRTDDVQALLAQTSTQYQVTETGEVLEGPAPDERQHEAPHSALYVPMKVEGRVMGVMQVQSEGRDAYTQEDEDLLAAIANVAAVAVQNARLYLAVQSELAERQHAEALLDEQAQQLQQVMDTVPEGVLLVDVHGNLLLSNPLGRELVARLAPETGPRGISELAGRPIQELLEAPALGAWHTLVAAGRTYQAAARPLAVADGSLRWVLVLRDTTDQEELERRLRQQDRMAIIGQLAGGVAHDFNNLLTTILGYTELVLEELPEGSPQRADLGEVRHAAERAAGLTNQLLAFSRQQVVQPRVVSLNQVIGDMLKMLQRLIGEQVSLRVRLAPDLSETLVDPGQLEQVILNLAVNARDAMPQGGTLTLQTLNTTLDEVYTRQYPDVTPGRYVRLDVSDTGTGIAPEVLAHMFEPFFTTKGVGKGTGLGLATVMGIIKQAGGHVTVYSEVGVGSTFKVYLPVCIESETTDDEAKPARPMRSIGGEVVLLVEDEEGVRRLARRTLEEWGYTVLEAATPAEALRLGAEYPGDIHLLLTDVIMPEMSGPAVAEVLRRAFPALPVLYISGYTDDAIAHHGVLEPGVAFLGKPFTAAELTARVRAALDGRTPA
jgi:signal transduction histidine kinase/ActR/RegA family two-component response regulator